MERLPTRKRQMMCAIPLKSCINMTGFIPEEDLICLYRQAEIFVYPSLFEGVGLPVLEAMEAGVPVITSNTSSLREIAGDAALTVNPLDTDEMKQSIYKMVNEKKIREDYITKGRTRVKAFSWRTNAIKTLKVYQEVMSSDGGPDEEHKTF
jgi:glycosyltransferase involved in cell wall biosynthesis